jgi:DMSO reductase family type II enzyme heme b subunit
LLTYGHTEFVITAVRVDAATQELLDPTAAAWQSVPEKSVTLLPTPLGSQPSVYILAAWEGREYGLDRELSVRAAHNGEAIFFRLAWNDDTEDVSIPDTDRFTDAAAVLFPLKERGLIITMGSTEDPLNAWYWRPDLERPINVTVNGLGTSVRHSESFLMAASEHSGEGWSVVMGRPFDVDGPNAASLHPDRQRKAGFAVWQGSNQERAGLKAVTLDWEPLEIEA